MAADARQVAVLLLRPEHGATLARFRIPPEMLEAAGVRSVTDAEARERLGLHGHQGTDLGGILFPYLSPLTGVRVGGRIRLDNPLPDDGGKYISELGCRHFFFPPHVGNFLRDLKVPVVIVEAEKSALALRALADRVGRPMLPIAIGGCWGWRRKTGKRRLPNGDTEPETGPAPDLDMIVWQGRSAILAFDSNALTNPKVQQARRALVKELSRRGARVLVAQVPSVEGVNGPDDLIALHGDATMLRALDSEAESSELPERIRAVVLENTIPLFDKRRRISELIEGALRERGEFCRTPDERLFFFETSERRLYDLEETCFGRLLTNLSGLSATEAFFKFALDTLQARQSNQARLVEVHSFAYHNPETSLLAVSDGAGAVWFRERGGQWRLGRNGEEGLYFVTERESSPWVPELSATPDALDCFLECFRFADALLSREEARTAFTVWILQQFFPELRRTRIIPTFLGQQGSGKTTGERLVGRLLLGPSFDVTGIQREREDAFVAAVTNRVLLGLDNADSKIPWLADSLSLYATGQKYRLRKLYTTNQEVSYAPRAILMISSRDPQFNRPDVSERLLPIYCERPERYFTEAQIFDDLQKRRGAVMGALLNQVAHIADSLPEVEPRAMPFRMADFASFGERLFRPIGRSGEWLGIMEKIERAQSAFASEGDGIVTAILELVAREGVIAGMSIGDLFKKCSDLAEEEGLALPRSLQGFGRALSTRRRVIELEGGVCFQEFRGEHSRRFISIRKKEAAQDVGAS